MSQRDPEVQESDTPSVTVRVWDADEYGRHFYEIERADGEPIRSFVTHGGLVGALKEAALHYEQERHVQ